MAIFEPGDYAYDDGAAAAIVAIVTFVTVLGLYFLVRWLYDTRGRTGDGNV